MDLMWLIFVTIIGACMLMLRDNKADVQSESLMDIQTKSDFVVENLPFCGPAARPVKCFMYYQEVLKLCR